MFLPEVITPAYHVQKLKTDIPDQEEFIQQQARGNECREAAINVTKRHRMFSYESDGVPVRPSLIDGALQKYVPAALCARILRLCYHSSLVRHPGERRMYEKIRRYFCWSICRMTYTGWCVTASAGHGISARTNPNAICACSPNSPITLSQLIYSTCCRRRSPAASLWWS